MVVLICISLMISDVKHLFYVPIGHLHFLFGKMAIQICPCFNQVVSLFDVELYELFIYLVY